MPDARGRGFDFYWLQWENNYKIVARPPPVIEAPVVETVVVDDGKEKKK